MADDNKKRSHKETPSKKTFSKDHTLKKRPPQKPEVAENVVYVSTKSNVKALLERCSKLIEKEEPELIIYCLGAAIQRGILLALQVTEKHLSYRVSANTLTSQLIDDLEPATDEADYEIQRRHNSALRIKITKTDLLETPSPK